MRRHGYSYITFNLPFSLNIKSKFHSIVDHIKWYPGDGKIINFEPTIG